MADIQEPAGPSTGRALRTRNKSQRALESEQTNRLLARAKQEELNGPPTSALPKKRRVKKEKRAEVYCICKTSGEDGKSMIECGTCNDWFHFDCVKLDENEAEQIHKYVCDNCHESTGEKTSHVYDISILPSPSPPPGFERPSAKATVARKPRKNPVQRSSPRPSASGTTSSDDTASEVDNDSEGSESSAEAVSDSKRKTKRARLSTTTARVNPSPTSRVPAVRKVSTSISGGPAALPPARVHVLQRMTQVVKELFHGKLSEEKVRLYAEEVETALWANFKDLVAGKETAGGRYKAQFNSLSSSLLKDLRPELRDSILEHALTPAQVAVLTPADLASAERAKEIEAAKQAVLQQTVKTKLSEAGAIRLGRDGLERVEDFREKEMLAIQIAEREARDTKSRKESILPEGGDIDPPSETAGGQVVQSPAVMHHQRSMSAASVSSTPVARAVATPIAKSVVESPGPPARSFSLSSAWADSSAAVDIAAVTESFGEDQNQLDLSDIISEPQDVDIDVTSDSLATTGLNAIPIVWSGLIANNATPDAASAPVVLRHISSQTAPLDWDVLLPHREIHMTGLVRPEAAGTFLETTRCHPSKELIAAVISVDPTESDERKAHWAAIVDQYLADNRVRVYYPYHNAEVPPRAAKDVYWYAVRPSDPLPSIAGLIDGFSLPDERSETVLLAFFAQKRDLAHRPKVHAPPAASLPPPIQNDKLQALMASLNPDVIKSLPSVGGLSPLAPIGLPAATPPLSGPSYPPHGHGSPGSGYGYAPAYGPQGSYAPSYGVQPEHHSHPRAYGHPSAGHERPAEEWHNQSGPPRDAPYRGYGAPPRSPRSVGPPRGGHRGRDRAERDNGWGSRAQGGGGGYAGY